VESISGFVEVLQSDFDLFNPPYFTGAGQKFLLHLQVGTLLQDYRVSFVEPWFLDRHLVLSTDLYRRVSDFNSADNLYDEARTGARVSLTRALFGLENFRGSLGYGIEDIDINHLSTNAPNEIIANGGNTLVSRFTGSLAYDTRNSVQLPSKGQETSLSSTLTVGSRDYVVTELKSGWYFRGLGKRDVLEIQGRAGVAQKLSSREIPFYDRFYLGGQDTLRGFDFRGVGPRAVTQDGFSYEPIGGDSYWMGSVEYSIPVLPSSDNVRFALFYDIGNVSQDPFSNSGFTVLGKSQVAGLPPPVVLFNPLAPVGNTGSYSDNYGFGIHINIPHLGPLRLDYGIPVHHDRFNSSSGKLQFGVGFSRPL
jgi:outer membrane protein insertion porin family